MKRKLKIMANLLLTAAFAAVSASCSEDEPVQATGVALNRTTLALAVGGAETLTATVTPDDAADKTVTWSSSAPEVAAVAGGVVTAVAKGTATITVSTVNDKTATCAVTVTEPESPQAIEVQDNASLTQEVFADQTQGKSDVTFTTTGAWTSLITEQTSSAKATDPQPKPLEADASIAWISISPDHGDKAGDYTVAVTLTPNQTGADRAAVITITCKGTEIAVAVTQKAENEDGTTGQVIDSGITGECTWTLTGAPGNYTLTISGNGAMGDYDYFNESPWYQRRDDIKTAVIQDGVTIIGGRAFSGCSGLTSVTIPNSVTTISNSAFATCSGLASVTISNSVQTIGSGAFFGCGLTVVTIPNSVITIGESAFESCFNLTAVTIPNSVQTIDEWAFAGCSSLTDIYVEAANTQYSSENGILFNKGKTTLVCYPKGKPGNSYVIPNSVTTIGHAAFYRSGLIAVTIPNSVQTIGSYVFNGCSSLTAVTIPNSVQTIGSYVFYDCSSLTVVTNLNPVPQNIDSDVFFGVNISALTLNVPAGAVNDYKAAPVWGEFGNIINPGMQAAFAWEVEGNFAEECVGVPLFSFLIEPALYYRYLLLKPGTLRIQFEDSHIGILLHDREPGYYAKTSTAPLTFAAQPTVDTNGESAWDVVMSADLNGKSGSVPLLCPRSAAQDVSFHLDAGTYWSTHMLGINTTAPDCDISYAPLFDAYEEDFVLKVTFTPDEE